MAQQPDLNTPPDEWRRQIDSACAKACQAIAPSWPLDRAIGVNPYWSRIGMPLPRLAARMAILGQIRVFPPRAYLHDAWRSQRITHQDLSDALLELQAAHDVGLTEALCLEALEKPQTLTPLPLLIDLLDDDPSRHTRLSWRDAITHQVSQTCAGYFDQHQADWPPQRSRDLFTFWRETITHDHGIGLLMGLPELGKRLNALPKTRQNAEQWVIEKLGLDQTVWADYLESVLLTVHGWASWCAYLGWEARLEGREESHLRDLLAVRLAWGVILLECKNDESAHRAFQELKGHWDQAESRLREAEQRMMVEEVWQRALEIGYQRPLAKRLVKDQETRAKLQNGLPPIEVQAAFCIDVRSEPLRRALESQGSHIQTLGFAGFFGLPVAYTPLATSARRPQLPGLLPATIEVSDRLLIGDEPFVDASLQEAAMAARRQHFARGQPLIAASRWPLTLFSFVEVAGIGYLGKLLKSLKPKAFERIHEDLFGLPTPMHRLCRPILIGLDEAQKVQLAHRILTAMGLKETLAPLVLLVGHGSQSENNAQAAALDCGACCGQTGEVNARTLARLLNEPLVRQGLSAKGIEIPTESRFLAVLHNTTTDEIEGFDTDLLPPEALARWERLKPLLATAGDQVRRERAPSLGLDPTQRRGPMLDQFRRRACDPAQTRPEWGLAGNAAFVIAPRHRTVGIHLAGRCFLHDYDSTQDPGGEVLELLMTAPMLVTHWINWQYHASTCDPQRMGSGNKVLHNVVGGQIGIFEGNGGDLRIGLSKQSLHDGQRWIHEPLRLTVIIDAPKAAIEKVIAGHEVLQHLLNHHWLHLWRFQDEGLFRFADGDWRALD